MRNVNISVAVRESPVLDFHGRLSVDREAGMIKELAVGAKFPDLELPDHAGHIRDGHEKTRSPRLDADPFAAVYSARRLHVAAGLPGSMIPPAGLGIQRYGAGNPWPSDRFESP